jgi:RHS repeat-associated protein
MDRLTHVEYPDGRTVEYEFDDLGNRARMVEVVGVPGAGDASPGGSGGSGGASAGQAVSQTIYTYDAGSRLLTAESVSGGDSRTVLHFGYDRNGNQVAKEDLIYAGGSAIGEDSWSFGFDGLNRLDGVVTPEAGIYRYTYAGDGLRVEKQSREETLQYVWDGEDLVLSADATHGGATAIVRGRRAVSALTSHGAEYLVMSLHQDLDVAMGADAETLGRWIFGAYGQLHGPKSALPAGTLESMIAMTGYRGEQRDPETGFYYLRARFYDASSGRFLSEDPIARGTPGATLQVSFYVYCGNNPVRSVDPSGLWYLDFNITAVLPCLVGATGGVAIDMSTGNIYFYSGGAAGTPGFSASVMVGLSSLLEGSYQAGGGGALMAVQGGSRIDGLLVAEEDSEFLEWGVLVGSPGANFTRYVMIQVYEAPEQASPGTPASQRTAAE